MLLETRSLGVTYGGVRALDDVSIGVGEGSLVGLIGPNGAGKTTFIDAVTGFASATGQVLLDGRRLDHLAPYRRARAGLVRSFQQAELFDDLDVRGNLDVAADRARWWSTMSDLVRPGRTHRRDDGGDGVDRAVDLLDIAHLVDLSIAQLSEGERKLVGLARALSRDPRLLLLDEPAAGLDTDESHALGNRLRAIVDAGTSIVLVDHDIDLVLGRCDVVHVLEQGRLIASGEPDDVRADDRVIAAYLGSTATTNGVLA